MLNDLKAIFTRFLPVWSGHKANAGQWSGWPGGDTSGSYRDIERGTPDTNWRAHHPLNRVGGGGGAGGGAGEEKKVREKKFQLGSEEMNVN